MTPEEKRRQRLEFMVTLYEFTDGAYDSDVDRNIIAGRLGWTTDTLDRVEEYLEREGLVETPSMGAGVAITHAGVLEVERALTHRDEATVHFAPATQVFIAGNVIGSQIQAGSPGGLQRQGDVALSDDRAAIEGFLDAFRKALGDPQMPADRARAATGRIQAVSAELDLPEPDSGIVREGLRSLRAMAENLAASGIFVGLVDLAQHIRFH